MRKDDPENRPGTSRPLMPTVALLLVLGVGLLVLGLWLGARPPRADGHGGPGPLAILDPPDSAHVQSPLALVFSTGAPLRLEPDGWHAGTLHLHALVDGQATMPAAADIEALGNGRFRWRLAGLSPGTHTIRLVWARPDHTTIPEGASAELTVEVR